jgi:ribose transport system substrate-binding protein
MLQRSKSRVAGLGALAVATALVVGFASSSSPTASAHAPAAPAATGASNPLAAATSAYTVAFANDTLTAPFNVSVQSGLVAAAKSAGVHLIAVNNNMDDNTAVENAHLFVNDKANVVIEFQIDESISQTIAQIYEQGGIKHVISIDIPEPNSTFFGANNYADGFLAGQHLGTYAKQHSWSADHTWLILMNLPAAGSLVGSRQVGQQKGVQATFPGIPSSQVISLNGADSVSTSQSVVASVLPRIPSGDHMIIAGITDESSVGALRALQVAGRASDAIESAQGADALGIQQIRTNPNWVGDTDYFPDFYGKYLLELIAKIRAGQHISPYVFMPHIFLDKANVEHYYPGKTTKAAATPPGPLQYSTTAIPKS